MGYKLHIFTKTVTPNLLCLSCEHVLKIPLTSICGHTLCHDCWLDRVERYKDEEEEYLTCMHCRTKTTLLEAKLKLNDELHNTILRLLTKCSNRNCHRELPLIQRELHMEVCKYNDKDMRLCCLKPTKRTNRIMRRGRSMFKAVSQRALYKVCRAAMRSAFETYTRHVNILLEPIAENLDAIEQLMDADTE